jgi:hypothetical protein
MPVVLSWKIGDSVRTEDQVLTVRGHIPERRICAELLAVGAKRLTENARELMRRDGRHGLYGRDGRGGRRNCKLVTAVIRFFS